MILDISLIRHITSFLYFQHRKEPNFEGHDLNVMPAWKKGYTGKGVVVAVVDDGKLGVEFSC